MERGPSRTRLESLIRAGDRTIEEWCLEFDRSAHDIGERTSLSARQLQRWMAGEVDSARPAARRVAAHIWGMDFAALLARPDAPVARPLPGLVSGHHDRKGVPSSTWKTVTSMAAYESSDHAMSVSGEVNAASVEHVRGEVRRLSEQFADRPPLLLLAEARHVRNLAYAALDRTRRPSQTADLYLAAGQLCGLMSVASFDLAVWDAASEQARAAYVYADLVDHDGLRTWARGTQAAIEYWTGRPRAALVHVEAGLALGTTSVGQARLRAIEARALAQLGGDRDLTYRAISEADDAQQAATGADELYDVIGGEFGWGPSRHAACVSTALLAIGDSAGAAGRARIALELLDADPSAGHVRERAHIDLAAADLAMGDLDAAVVDLEPVWSVPAVQRRHGLTDRLLDLSRMLTAPTVRNSPPAMTLRDRIEVFTTEARARALPPT